ncbi:50S ribosomal protein L18 [bacterium]|nr:50S ribosomal protein L18 [bacterium]
MYRVVNRRRVRELRKMRFWRRRMTDLSKPRLCIFRSARHIQVQLIDDKAQKVLAAATSFETSLRTSGLRGKDMAKRVGATIAERAMKLGLTDVVFDRNGFSYHGRVQVLADSARESGLKF